MKQVVICADDYAQNKAVSRGIVALIRRQRITATSCLVTSKHWAEHGLWLKPYLGVVDIGLHFNLTEGQALGAIAGLTDGVRLPSLPKLLLKCSVHTVTVAAIKAELVRQLARFQEVMGVLPDYIDGHQHVHQFPVVREALLEVYWQKLRGRGVYIRSTSPMASTPGTRLKAQAIALTGGSALRRRLQAANIPHNRSFTGAYAFQQAGGYPALCRAFLQAVGDQGLLMCHPGLESTDSTDPLMHSRFVEYTYFNSEQFDADCALAEVRIGRFQPKDTTSLTSPPEGEVSKSQSDFEGEG